MVIFNQSRGASDESAAGKALTERGLKMTVLKRSAPVLCYHDVSEFLGIIDTNKPSRTKSGRSTCHTSSYTPFESI
jgi:hypothetical protein